MNKIKVFVVDDHPIFRQGLRQVIESDPRMVVAGEAGDATEALAQIKSLKPQIAIVDIDLPRTDGLELARALQNLRPPIPAIILTMHKEEHLVLGALDRGVKGYVLKDNALNEVLGAVLTVAKGEFYITPSLSGCLVKRSQRAAALQKEQPALSKLTPMERRVLKLVAENKTSREIGKELFISPRTVDTHRANICAKLELRGSHKLLQFALAHQSGL
jgi:two-component system, NarL family, response regulator DegU